MLSRYDYLNGKELKNEMTKRIGTNKGKKPALPLNRNQAGYKYRLFLIADDLKRGLNPYLEQSVPSEIKDSVVQGDDVWPRIRQTEG
jgi:hypothetical protein